MSLQPSRTLTSIGPANRIARSEETHPLTWRRRDDAQPVWLEEYQQKNGYAAARKALTQMAQADIVQTRKGIRPQGPWRRRLPNGREVGPDAGRRIHEHPLPAVQRG